MRVVGRDWLLSRSGWDSSNFVRCSLDELKESKSYISDGPEIHLITDEAPALILFGGRKSLPNLYNQRKDFRIFGNIFNYPGESVFLCPFEIFTGSSARMK
jgi:hypothetical protein